MAHFVYAIFADDEVVDLAKKMDNIDLLINNPDCSAKDVLALHEIFVPDQSVPRMDCLALPVFQRLLNEKISFLNDSQIIAAKSLLRQQLVLVQGTSGSGKSLNLTVAAT